MAFETEMLFFRQKEYFRWKWHCLSAKYIWRLYKRVCFKICVKNAKNYSYKSVEIMLLYYFLIVDENALSRFMYMKACVKFWYMSVYKIVNCIIR